MDDSGAKKILVIDDDETLLTIAKNMLKNDYEVILSRSGKDALELFFHGTIPDLVLLDILMPDMDGWETFNRLKAITLLQDVPIAFLTSKSGELEEKRAYEIGAADFITKPFNKLDLLDRIKNILMK